MSNNKKNITQRSFLLLTGIKKVLKLNKYEKDNGTQKDREKDGKT